jgi:hypothetical protein
MQLSNKPLHAEFKKQEAAYFTLRFLRTMAVDLFPTVYQFV